MAIGHWLFQANPRYSYILIALQERPQIYWLITRYGKEIQPDDRVLLWIAGKQAGIYAIAQVVESPRFWHEPPDIEIWKMPIRARAQFYAPVQLTHNLLANPLYKTALKFDPILRELQVMQMPHNTNFRVTIEQWNQVQHLVQHSV